MNDYLNEKIRQYGLKKNTSFSTLKTFLNTCIAREEYLNIPGGNNEEKALFLQDYLHYGEDQNFQKEKKKIKIIIADNSSFVAYVDFLNKKYDVEVVKFSKNINREDIDLVLFTGGEDISPGYYGQKIGMYTQVNKERDHIELQVFEYFAESTPMLGICRGAQFLTAMNGGELIQHVTGHDQTHIILDNRTGNKYNMTSTHHQMLYPFNLNKNDYELIAHSENFKSNTYLNGNNEETELSEDFLEPEIVYYKNTNSLCIQGHPEFSTCEEITSKWCLNLIENKLINNKNNKVAVAINSQEF